MSDQRKWTSADIDVQWMGGRVPSERGHAISGDLKKQYGLMMVEGEGFVQHS
jgi:hypothetical protein